MRDWALANGGRFILIESNGFGERYSPKGILHQLCNEGRLLIIAPTEHHTSPPKLTYSECQRMNALAERIEQYLLRPCWLLLPPLTAPPITANYRQLSPLRADTLQLRAGKASRWQGFARQGEAGMLVNRLAELSGAKGRLLIEKTAGWPQPPGKKK